MDKIQCLPKDVVLIIMQKFDMDTRIKAGIVGKLKIPETLVAEITKSLSKRIPIPEWILNEKPTYISQRIAVRLPLPSGNRYELYYNGGGFWYVNNTTQKPSLLHTSHVCSYTCGFPDVQGLPNDFVAMHKPLIVKYPHKNTLVEYYVCKQSGSAYRSHPNENININCDNGNAYLTTMF